QRTGHTHLSRRVGDSAPSQARSQKGDETAGAAVAPGPGGKPARPRHRLTLSALPPQRARHEHAGHMPYFPIQRVCRSTTNVPQPVARHLSLVAHTNPDPQEDTMTATRPRTRKPASSKQLAYIARLAEPHGLTADELLFDGFTSAHASALIDALLQTRP